MDTTNPEPNTLQEAFVYFSDPDNCVDFLASRRWKDGVTCPTCGSENVSYIPKRRVWQCKTRHPKCQFSVKVGTIFEESPIALGKWLCAMWMLANCKNGVSSHEISRSLGITQKSAWFMLQRLRLALQDDDAGKLDGEVEVDETFIGGKARNMHASKRARRITGTGGKDKAVVVGMVERGGKVRTSVVSSRKAKVLKGEVRKHVTAGAALYSDALQSYDGLASEYAHKVIDHAVAYADGVVHTNTLENYWSLLKRGISGTYISVEPFHLFRYLDEQAFRYNHRHVLGDRGRFEVAVSQVFGKRLTYDEVTGKVGKQPIH